MTLDYTGQDPNGRTVNYTWNSQNKSSKAGQFKFDIVGSNPAQHLLAFCIDIANTLIQSATDYVEKSDLLDSDTILALDKLFTQHYASVTTRDTSAGFQLAIWEIVTDTQQGAASQTYDLTDGDFRLRGSNRQQVVDAANDFLTLGDATGGYKLTFFDSVAQPKSSQDLVSASPVPLPAAAWMLGMGILGLAGVARSKRKG